MCKEKLLSTKRYFIVEVARYDMICGMDNNDNPNILIPLKWNGSNVQGWELMEVRNILSILIIFFLIIEYKMSNTILCNIK